MKSFVVTAALACSFLAAPGVAQPAGQLLQRGIYNQETAGDLDAAIQVYRQLVAAPDRAIAAQAQFRLTETLLAKGDLAAAGEEFRRLARDFADSPFAKTMGARARALGGNGVPQLLGSFQNGRYHHNLTGTELTVPSDWSFPGQKAQPDGFDRVDFADPSGRASAFLVVRQDSTPAAQIAERLRQRLDSKLAGQRQDSDEMHGFRLRPESIQPRLIGGHQAVYAVGDYADGNGERTTEYQVFIQTEKTAAFFSGRAKAGEFATMQPRFDQMVNSLVVP
jgi:hypothetical protein